MSSRVARGDYSDSKRLMRFIRGEAMTEKINHCDKDGKCTAQCLEDQKACEFYSPLKTFYSRNCVTLIGSNCMHPDALVAKWKALKAAAKPAER